MKKKIKEEPCTMPFSLVRKTNKKGIQEENNSFSLLCDASNKPNHYATPCIMPF